MHQQELLKGNTTTLLLALLELEPMYGYQIVKEMNRRSSGYFAFKEGTLYPALHRLEQDNLVEGRVVNQIVVDEKTKQWARVALERMLSLV